jgi:hypothetical protein
MATRETGKQRASRIPLDYYKRPNRLERWKGTLALLALLASVGAAAAAWILQDGGRPYASRGPVAAVHAAWDNNCEACHAGFRPVSKSAAMAALFPASGGHAADLNCRQCHEGTAHHTDPAQLDALTPSCGGCHRDHRGRDASLVQMPDSDCTRCHSDLKASTVEGKASFENAITGLADKGQGHPDFRSLKSDPGRLKFNHRLHMLPGQVLEPGQAKPWTLGRIADKTARERYAAAPWQADKSDAAPVVLDCGSCHRRDAGDFGITPANRPEGLASAALTPRAAGDYVLPINYETHCAACHPLTFDANLKGKDGQPVSVPHRLQPDEVKDFVRGAYVAAYGNKSLDQRVADAAKAGPKPSRPLPGKLTAEEQAALDSAGNESQKAEQFLFKADVARADGYLTSGKSACGECHVFDTAGESKRVLPVQVNNVWLRHAKFSHVAHRAFDCRGCHANAYAYEADGKTLNKNASVDHSDVLIAGVDNCRQCHAPAAGVRSDCGECHLYHNGSGDHSLQGLGAAARDPGGAEKPRRFSDVSQFLRGTAD